MKTKANETNEPVRLNLGDLTSVDSKEDYSAGQPLYKLLMGYLVAALWTSDDSAPSGDYVQTGQAEIMLPKYSPEALGRAFTDCKKFFVENRPTIEKATVGGSTNNWEHAGHDFWLTRNGHGCGFWDGDWSEPAGALLDQAAKAFKEITLETGDNGKLYFL